MAIHRERSKAGSYVLLDSYALFFLAFISNEHDPGLSLVIGIPASFAGRQRLRVLAAPAPRTALGESVGMLSTELAGYLPSGHGQGPGWVGYENTGFAHEAKQSPGGTWRWHLPPEILHLWTRPTQNGFVNGSATCLQNNSQHKTLTLYECKDNKNTPNAKKLHWRLLNSLM